MIAIAGPIVVVDHSEPTFVRSGHAVLRWVLAPFGATAAFGGAILATYLIAALIYGAEVKNKESFPAAVYIALALLSSFVSWTWVGTTIAPPQHRRVALGVFSAPVVLITAILVAGARLRNEEAAIALAAGSVLACAGILVLAFHSRFAFARVPAPTPVQPTRRPAATQKRHSRSASPPETHHSGASPSAAWDGLSSGPRYARHAISILRWVLAPIGAAAVSVLVLAILYQLSVYLFGREDIGRGGRAEIIVLPVIVCVVIAWAWVGASITPRGHRRWALIAFAVPPALFSVFALLPIASEWLPPGRIMIGVGSLLGSAVAFAMASNPRYGGSLAERFETFVSREKSISLGEPELSANVAPSPNAETQRAQHEGQFPRARNA